MNIKQTIFSLLIPLFFVFTNTPLFSQEHSDEVPPLLLWNYASLEEAKSLIGKEEALTVAYKQLLKDAQSAMEIQRISVVDKTGPAPSGNPHDYVSIGIWYDCQILTWSLFLNQKESALKYYREVALPRAMKLIQPNGQIPSELRRTRSWSYTVYALQALCNLSLLSQHLGEHLATYTGSSGASLQEAIRYPYNYLSKPNSWPHKQIGKDLGKLNFDVAFFALQQYGEEAFPNLRDYLKNSIPQNARIRLLHGSLK